MTDYSYLHYMLFHLQKLRTDREKTQREDPNPSLNITKSEVIICTSLMWLNYCFYIERCKCIRAIRIKFLGSQKSTNCICHLCHLHVKIQKQQRRGFGYVLIPVLVHEKSVE